MSRKRKQRKHPHWVGASEPPLRTVIHATMVTLPEGSKESYERLWSTPLLSDLRTRAEAEGLNPLAVLNVVFDHVGASKNSPSPMSADIVGDPADVARVKALGKAIWLESPGGVTPKGQ